MKSIECEKCVFCMSFIIGKLSDRIGIWCDFYKIWVDLYIGLPEEKYNKPCQAKIVEHENNTIERSSNK